MSPASSKKITIGNLTTMIFCASLILQNIPERLSLSLRPVHSSLLKYLSCFRQLHWPTFCEVVMTKGKTADEETSYYRELWPLTSVFAVVRGLTVFHALDSLRTHTILGLTSSRNAAVTHFLWARTHILYFCTFEDPQLASLKYL